MNRSKIIALTIIVLAVGAGVTFYLTKDKPSSTDSTQTQSQPSSSTENQSETNQEPTTESSQTFTKEEVAKHNNKGDCWIIIDEKVYNVTTFIESHEGGDEILRACGIDGTSLFTERQTEDGEDVGTGTPHSEEAEKQLEKLFIGTVSD